MSVRIYQLSKQLHMENKELIALLRERGLKADSPSNTIPNIYADALLEEFKDRLTPGTPTSVSSNDSTVTVEKTAPTAKPVISALEPTIVATPEPVAAELKAVSVAPSSDSAKKAAPLPPMSLKKAPAVLLPRAPTPVRPISQAAVVLPSPQPVVVANSAIQPTPTVAVATIEPEVTISGLDTPSTANRNAPKPAPFLQRAPSLPPRPSKSVEAPLPEGAEVAPKRKILCKSPIVVRDFAALLDIKPFKLISELMELGVFASMNQVIEEELAVRLAQRHGIELEVRHRGETPPQQVVKKVEPKVAQAVLEPRPAVVCVLGHVDHGKTTLLDTIRRTSVVKGEAGGITQHIGAYQVEHKSQKITFIDTPGHAAFSKMRERGANVTDIAVLVVAADDGFMPQTDEALKFAQKAGVPVVVAINKMDAKGANPDKIKQQLQQRGIASEDWGGETLVCPISALKGDGMPELLDSILLQAEMLQLSADIKAPASATIVEAQMEQGLGPTATVIVKEGVLKIGDNLVCGGAYCRVRSMMDDKGKAIKEARPATPIKLIGWSAAPEAGLIARVVKNEKEAKVLADEYLETRMRNASSAAQQKAPMDIHALFAALDDQKKVLKVLIKGDVQGSVEALEACLLDIKSAKVSLEVVDRGVGLISKNDIVMASTAGAAVVAFNTRFDTGVQAIAKHHGVRIVQHNIIYELIDQVRAAMADLLDPELKEVKIGAAEVRQIFELSRVTVAGCMVTEGKIGRDAKARVLRKGAVLHEGGIQTLKRFKDDANEVRAGYECGVRLDGNFNDYQAKDIIECFQIDKIPASL